MDEIELFDQTIRDAQQSLWGFRMPTDMILPIAPMMDRIGYRAIGVVGGRGTAVAVRYLHENIFNRFRQLSKAMPRTPLRSSYMAQSAFGFDVEPLAAIELWIRRSVANGIRSFWVCDYQNMMERLAYLTKVATEEGAEVVIGLMFTLSPVHTDELFAKKVRMVLEMGGVDAIHVEDTGGILTPERTRTLLAAIKREAKEIPIEFHEHCTLGIAPMSYVEAIKAGIRILHTAVSPLANGDSLPSAENTIRNAYRLGFNTKVDQEALQKVSDYFRDETIKRGMPLGIPVEYDMFHFEHQAPGGMMGTMKNQLNEIGQINRLDELLEEVARIRVEFGYPVMATPYSQIVAAQALFNVTSGNRYSMIPNEVVKYALGYYGEPDGPMDPDVKDKILNSPKAKLLKGRKIREVTLKDLRNLDPSLSDDDLLMRISNPEGEFKEKLNTLYGRS
jgi:oxaloacetate decarboxylase (Na+ extruding) subunit alpha